MASSNVSVKAQTKIDSVNETAVIHAFADLNNDDTTYPSIFKSDIIQRISPEIGKSEYLAPMSTTGWSTGSGTTLRVVDDALQMTSDTVNVLSINRYVVAGHTAADSIKDKDFRLTFDVFIPQGTSFRKLEARLGHTLLINQYILNVLDEAIAGQWVKISQVFKWSDRLNTNPNFGVLPIVFSGIIESGSTTAMLKNIILEWVDEGGDFDQKDIMFDTINAVKGAEGELLLSYDGNTVGEIGALTGDLTVEPANNDAAYKYSKDEDQDLIYDGDVENDWILSMGTWRMQGIWYNSAVWY